MTVDQDGKPHPFIMNWTLHDDYKDWVINNPDTGEPCYMMEYTHPVLGVQYAIENLGMNQETADKFLKRIAIDDTFLKY